MPPILRPSYKKPPVPLTWKHPGHRPLLSIRPPPPELITRPKVQKSSSEAGVYLQSTHLVPAAWPRATPINVFPSLDSLAGSKEDRAAAAQKIADTLYSTTKEYVEDGIAREKRHEEPASGHKEVLWNSIHRYVRKNPSGKGVTLFFAHANGFPKEIWKTTLAHLFDDSACSSVDEIWLWEAVHHGDSGVINKGKLGYPQDWRDLTRDILNFLRHFIPSSAEPTQLPLFLPQIPESETRSRVEHGFRGARELVVVGHSLGGATSTLAALEQPSLFSSLILVDPVIGKPVLSHSSGVLPLGAVRRRSTWTTKHEALRGFKASPFFNTWDPQVLADYVEYGISEGPDESAHLKMSGMQEAAVFSDVWTHADVWDQLPTLDERIPLRWIMPGRGDEGLGDPRERAHKVWLRPNNASNVRITSAGHLIAQEAPRELAQEIAQFLGARYSAGQRPHL